MPHYLDILIAIPLLWAAYRGFKKGLVIELAGLAALILGIYCALKFSDFISDFIVEQWAYEGKYLPIISFALTFIVVVLLVHLLGKAIEKMLDVVALGAANKLAGAFFNIMKVAIVISTTCETIYARHISCIQQVLSIYKNISSYWLAFRWPSSY